MIGSSRDKVEGEPPEDWEVIKDNPDGMIEARGLEESSVIVDPPEDEGDEGWEEARLAA